MPDVIQISGKAKALEGAEWENKLSWRRKVGNKKLDMHFSDRLLETVKIFQTTPTGF